MISLFSSCSRTDHRARISTRSHAGTGLARGVPLQQLNRSLGLHVVTLRRRSACPARWLRLALLIGVTVPTRLTAQTLIVGPKGGQLVVFPNTSGTAQFTLTGLVVGQSYEWAYSCSGAATSCNNSAPGNPTGPYFTATAYGQDITINFSTGSPWTGTISLTAQGNGRTDTGSFNLGLNSYGPVVSTLPTNGDYRDVTKCAANCFDGVASYSTPPYYSQDVPRSVQLNYRSSQAHPMGVVLVDAVDTSTVPPVTMSIQLYSPQGTQVTFTNNSREIFDSCRSHPADGNVNRLAAEFDASSLSTGAYNYIAVVRSHRSDGSFVETDVWVRILIANEVNSPLGAGWSIPGFQHGYLQSDGSVVITEGNGSIAFFAIGGKTCGAVCTTTYSSPKGDFTTFRKDSGGTCSPAPCPTYTRSYPAGGSIGFDASLRMVAWGGFYWDGDAVSRAVNSGHKPPKYLPRIYISASTFGYNASNLLVAMTDSIGKADTLGYDGSNHLRWIKDPGGRVDSITVDASGNLTRIKDQAGGLPFQGTYDSQHRLVQLTDRRGSAWGLAYDFAGKLAADTAPQVTASGQTVRPVVAYASIEKAVLIDTATHRGSSLSPGPMVDTVGVRAIVTNARGYGTTYALDRFGAANLIQEPLGRTTSVARDSNSTVVRTRTPSGHVIKYTWSGPDLTQTVDSTTGRTISYTYTAHYPTTISGHVDSVVNYWRSAPPPQSGLTGQLDSTHTGGAGTTGFRYGSDGRLCTIIDAAGHAEGCYFTSTSGFHNTDSISNTLGSVVGYRYDNHGQMVMTIDPVGDTTQTVYDAIGRIVKTIGPLHEADSLTYDGLYLTQQRDAKGQVYRLWPNTLGWPDSVTDPNGKVDRYAYDLNGNRTSWTNRNGQTITYAFDSLDQVRTMVAGGKSTTFFSDPTMRYSVVSDSESVDTLKFDAADRPWVAISCRVLTSGNAPQCFRDSLVYETASSQFGPRDLRTQSVLTAPTIWASGTQLIIGHHYDVHELLDTLTPGHLNTQSGQPITFVYSVEALDSITTLTSLNNLAMTHSYPWTHRTDQVQLSDPTITAALGTAYYFNNAGRLATRYHGSLSSPDTTRTLSYGRQGNLVWYADSSHQTVTTCSFTPCGGYHCTNSTQPSFVDSTRYVYDSVGNRIDPSATNGGLDWGNRQRRWQNYRMDYDAAGNMTAKRTLSSTDSTKLLRTDSLFWSALGRLDSVRTRDSSTGTLIVSKVGFGYDGWGRRIRKSSGSSTSRYLWDGEVLLAQLDTLGNDVAGYTYYPGEDNLASVLRRDRGDSSYYSLRDYSRNVLALLAKTSAGVTIDNQYRYDPFGNLQGSSTSTIPNTLQFAGREYDAETQLYYDRARYLDPALGRFVSEDPIGLRGGVNPYTFVGNDPVNVSDPSGEKIGDNIDVELCGGYQQPLHDAGEHLAIGWALVHWGFARRAEKWLGLTPVSAAFAVGIAHEGPWWDGDLTRSEGAPCNGIGDIFLFMVVPLVNVWGWSGPVVSTQYPWVPSVPGGGSSPVPGFPGSGFLWPGALPPTIFTGIPQGTIL